MAQPVGRGLLKVPFARCGDNIPRHVSAVTGVELGPFHCLDCGEALTLRRPIDKRRHFAHRPDSLCTGETALHRYAKEILALRKTLTLPSLVLEREGVFEEVLKSGTYGFEEVHPEFRMDAFQPDALVRYQGIDLAIEFRVNHAVDAEKREKVFERDISMVEIDLSGVNAGQMDGDALDAAILHTAPRHWIHHRKTKAARERLNAAVAKMITERAARLRGHILRKRVAVVPDDWSDEAEQAVRRTGLEALIGVEANCGHWFTVPDRAWQAQALFEHVIKPSELYAPGGKSLEVKGEFPKERDLSSKLPGWMIRTDLTSYQTKKLAEAGFSKESFGSPDAAVWSYLATLTTKGQGVFWSREQECFYVEGALHSLLHRRIELPRIVTGLLKAAEVADPEAAYLRWADTYSTGGATAAEIVVWGGEGYRCLKARLAQLEAMVPSYSRRIADDLCGLPLETIRSRNEAAIASDAAEKQAAIEKAAADRIASIRAQAQHWLEEEAQAWLGQCVKGTETRFLDYAGESEAALAQLEKRLAHDSAERKRRIAAERNLVNLRTRLSAAAKGAYPTEQLAELFLNSGQPKLGGRRPIDYCRSEQDLSYIITLMPKKK